MATIIKVQLSELDIININLDNVTIIKPYMHGCNVYFSKDDKIFIAISHDKLSKILERIYD